MKYSLSKYAGMKRKQAMVQDYKEEMFRKEFEKVINVTSCSLPVKKMKRYRSAFTTEQVNYLEKEFRKHPYIGNTRRKDVSSILNIPERAVKIWFQNRRMKEKKDGVNKETDIDEPNNAKNVAIAINSHLINSDLPSTNDQSLPLLVVSEKSSTVTNIDKNDVINNFRYTQIASDAIEKSPCKDKHDSLNPDLVTSTKVSNMSPSVIMNNPASSSNISAEFSIELLKKYRSGCIVENAKENKVKIENEFTEVELTQGKRSSPFVGNPGALSYMPASTTPQDLSPKSNPQQFQGIFNKPMPGQNEQRNPEVNVNSADIPLYLRGFYAQPYVPPGKMIWKPVNIAPVMATGVPAVISNSGSIAAIQQQNMPRRNCGCDCHLKPYSSPLVFQHSNPSPQVQYVLTAVPCPTQKFSIN